MTKKVLVMGLILGLLVVVASIFVFGKTENNPSTETPPDEEGMVACTMEAKICPDGSSVGRSGPNCEFAPCP